MHLFLQAPKARRWFGVIAIASISALLAFPLWQPQAQTTPKTKVSAQQLKHAKEFGFITVRTPTGSECRPISAAEARQMPLQARSVELHALGGNQPRSTKAGLVIHLNGTTQLDSFPQAKAAFQRAAAKWQAVIQTTMNISLDVDFGTTRFGTPYPSANIIGSTDPIFLLAEDDPVLFPNPFRLLRLAALDTTTEAQQAAFLNALPSAGLPTELGTSRNAAITLANLRGLELFDDTDVADFDSPSIGFNSAIEFDFDPSDGIDNTKIDFEATAVHEIGHALGFSSWVGDKELAPSVPLFPAPWDWFRFRGGPLDFSAIAARPRVMVAGGEHTYFIGDELGLSTATPAATNGDGRQASHWKDDLLTGQFVGIMDPTAADGDREETTFGDLTTMSFFGYKINPDARAFDIQSIADASREETQDRPNTTVVNRYAPSRYPARLEGLRILMPLGSEVGQSIRLIAFVDNNRTGQPPAAPALLLNQTITIPSLPATRYVEFRFATPLTINSGDVYLGMNVGASGVRFAADTTRPQGRSWVSNNDGASWSAFGSVGLVGGGANFMARALFSATYGTPLAAQTVSLSPSAVAPGTANVTLFVSGRNFQRNSVIRWNGADRATTYLTNGRLSTLLQAADVASASTAQVRVFTPGGAESGALTFTVGQDNPLPTLASVDPPTGPAGASGLTINVYGSNFSSASRVRINNVEKTTTFRNSTQLEVALAAADLTGGSSAITVVNPAPGGGTSNAVNFNVTGCNFSFASGSGTAITGFIVSSIASGNGFTLNVANAACSWSATTTESWLTVVSPTSGNGRTVISFATTENTGGTPRTAQIRVNNQTFDVRQAGRVANVSAASYVNNGKLAPNSIVAVFGQGIATGTAFGSTIPLPTQLGDTVVAVTDSQLVTRNSQLFFASPGQINFLIPGNTALGTARVRVLVSGSLYADQVVTIVANAPGLFAANANGQGVPAALLLRIKPDNSQVYEDVAVIEGGRFVPRALAVGPDNEQLFLILYGTGIRGVTVLNSVQLKLADQAVPALYAGAQGQFVGLDQINLNLSSIRATLRGRGEVTLNGVIDGTPINALTLRFQ